MTLIASIGRFTGNASTCTARSESTHRYRHGTTAAAPHAGPRNLKRAPKGVAPRPTSASGRHPACSLRSPVRTVGLSVGTAAGAGGLGSAREQQPPVPIVKPICHATGILAAGARDDQINVVNDQRDQSGPTFIAGYGLPFWV